MRRQPIGGAVEPARIRSRHPQVSMAFIEPTDFGSRPAQVRGWTARFSGSETAMRMLAIIPVSAKARRRAHRRRTALADRPRGASSSPERTLRLAEMHGRRRSSRFGEVLGSWAMRQLAIFPIREGPATKRPHRPSRTRPSPPRATRSARLSRTNERLAEMGTDPIHGLGLHVGDVMYRNIGVPERLDVLRDRPRPPTRSPASRI